jgi:hypothetical protein
MAVNATGSTRTRYRAAVDEAEPDPIIKWIAEGRARLFPDALQPALDCARLSG